MNTNDGIDGQYGVLREVVGGVNPKDLVGEKKAPLRLVPPALLIETARAMATGADKYGPFNWREYPVKASIYVEALLRHVFAYYDGEDLAEDTGVPHLAHAAACIAILMDAEPLGNLVDDRPKKGPAAALLWLQDRSKMVPAENLVLDDFLEDVVEDDDFPFSAGESDSVSKTWIHPLGEPHGDWQTHHRETNGQLIVHSHRHLNGSVQFV